MKILKGLGFFLLAVLIYCGFITPISIVPSEFEQRARMQTEARLEQSGSVVDESYIRASVDEAVHSNLHTIYRTAIILSLAVAFIVCLITLRPPHDCGGFNFFNPLAIPLIAIITISCALGVALVLDKVQGRGVTEFKLLLDQINAGCTTRGDRLLVCLIIPVMLEIIFRGYIFSLIEKLHFSIAIVISTVMYGFGAYYCFYSYGMRSIGSSAAAEPALFIALFVGVVFSIMTWRLHSGIPAVLAHILFANSAPIVESLRSGSLGTLPAAIVALTVALAALVFLPVLLARKIQLFAYDYPFTRHHKQMNKWFRSAASRRKAQEDRERAEAELAALLAAEDGADTPVKPAPAEEAVAEEAKDAAAEAEKAAESAALETKKARPAKGKGLMALFGRKAEEAEDAAEEAVKEAEGEASEEAGE